MIIVTWLDRLQADVARTYNVDATTIGTLLGPAGLFVATVDGLAA